MKRIWNHFETWEEIPAGMWRDTTASERKTMLPRAVAFTGDAELYGKAMLRVVSEWRFSCEQNLTDMGQNRKAWIGHAAACLAESFPEYVTRQAWGFLTKKQQDDANEKAREAIVAWERKHETKNTAVHIEMGRQMLLQWDTGLRPVSP